MNKFWLGFGVVTVFLTGWLYGRGRFGEDAFNKDAGTEFRSEDLRPETFKPDERRPDERRGDQRRNLGRNVDDRSEFERAEDQGSLKFDAQRYQQKEQTPQALSVSKNPAIDSTSVNGAVRNNFPNAGSWFSGNFWGAHGLYNNTPGLDAWRAATWADAAGWVGANWGNAIEYDPNGSSVDISQPGSSDYVATGQDAYMNPPSNQTANTANVSSNTSNVAYAGSTSSWIPLGVYALGTDTVDPSDTNLFLQLAMNKNGEITGTYYNAKTDKAETLKGSIDKSNQMVSFSIANRFDSPIISTGLYNLTLPESAVNVIMPDTSQRTWSMVKINNQ